MKYYLPVAVLNMIYESNDIFLSYKVTSNVRKVFLEFIKKKFAELK